MTFGVYSQCCFLLRPLAGAQCFALEDVRSMTVKSDWPESRRTAFRSACHVLGKRAGSRWFFA